jgi:PAS domain S-box-containing protein
MQAASFEGLAASVPSDLAAIPGLAVGVVDASGRLRRVNERFQRLVGRSEDELRALSPQDLSHPDDIPETERVMALLRAGQPASYIKRYLRPDASVVWARVHATPLRGEQGQPTGALAIIEDITAERQAESALRESEARLRTLFEQFPSPLALLRGPELRFVLANAPYLRLVGREVLGLPLREALPELEGQEVGQALERVFRTGATHVGREHPIVLDRQDGNGPREGYFDLVFQAVRSDDGRIDGLLAAGFEVTDSVLARRCVERARTEAQQSEARLRLALEATRAGIWDWDLRSGRVDWDPRTREVFGLPPEAPLGYDQFLGLVHPDDRAGVAERIERALGGEDGGRYQAEFRITRTADGKEVWVQGTGQVIFEDGRPSRFIGTVLDVTRRREREQALRRSEEVFRAIGESAPIGIFLAAADGSALYANPFLGQLVQAAPEEFLGTGWAGFVHPDDRARAFKGWQAATAKGAGYEDAFRWVRRDGRTVWSVVRAGPVGRDGAVDGYVGVVEDVTERKEADAAKARFLSVVAHELRTPMTPVVLQLRALEGTALDERQARHVGILGRNILRLNSLVTQLLEVARLESGQAGGFRLERRPIDLAEVAREAVATYEAAAAAAGLRLALEPCDPLPLEGDPHRLTQVLVNFLSNAVRATPPGGSVTVRCGVEGEAAVVRVTDSGVGLEPAQVAQLFQPFRRLQEGSAGSGLGLYISRTIVEQHGGRIWAESAGPGAGCTFAFSLPLARAEAPAAGAVAPPAPA